MQNQKEQKNIVKERLGVFIDGANIYYASKQAGWKLDIEKTKALFESIFDIQVFNYYAALPNKSDSSYADSKKYLDIEISLDVVRNLENLDEVMVLSGDSDYLELWKYVFVEKGKKIRFVSFKNNLAFELKKTKYLILEKIREFVELNREKNSPDLSVGRISVLAIIDDRGSLSSGDVDNI